ncbi:hypothetical protein ULMA_06710 [Patiriisocius marinus]|uniref:Uncharacterized protein n=1 Tax=Patiriisocius marinus TaxID=1397112 RepID=A0A5J4IYM1_9FLAO|nr:hypothetical protein [Patiriisocius marinus]GER58563.1 hypothetical protein ULMA_06710 [Patiriisocius marinus]
MKNAIYIFLFATIILSCNKDDNETNDGYFLNGRLSFSILNQDGAIPDDNSIEISSTLVLENGELVPPNGEILWTGLGKVEYLSDISKLDIYGPECPGNCTESYDTYSISLSRLDENNLTIEDYYAYLKYPDGTLDTLKFKGGLNESDKSFFRLFINDVEIQTYDMDGVPYDGFDKHAYVTLNI